MLYPAKCFISVEAARHIASASPDDCRPVCRYINGYALETMSGEVTQPLQTIVRFPTECLFAVSRIALTYDY